MTPQERTEFEKLKKTVMAMQRGEDPSFIENIRRRLDFAAFIRQVRLGDLFNVDDNGITNGQLLKFNSTNDKYEPANDIDT